MKESLSLGKIRGLQQISTPQGILAMCAMDHRGSLREMIGEAHPGDVGYEEMVEHKLEMCAALAPCSSAVLLDPNYGAAQCITGGVLPGQVGLLVSLEASGYSGGKGARLTSLLEGWGAEKVKRMRGSAAKLLLYYRPDLEGLAARQLDTVSTAAQDCLREDLPFLLEPKTYLLEGEQPQELAARKPELVIRTAEQVTALPIDVLKAEFPADPGTERDRGLLLELCRRLDAASRVPWVLLSAGVDFEVFCQQVELACQAGASGFLGGRAIWQEAVHLGDRAQRLTYLSTTAADRMKRLSEIAAKYGAPWYRKLGLSANELSRVAEGWYSTY